MKAIKLFLIFIACFFWGQVKAENQIIQDVVIRVSYKVVLNPQNGQRPTGATNEAIDEAVRQMNTRLSSYKRGFRVKHEILTIGGQGQTTGPSKWFATDFFSDGNAKPNMQREAENDASDRFILKYEYVNIYITQRTGTFSGGQCSFPRDARIIVVSDNTSGDGDIQLHEIGHFFHLFHTHGEKNTCSARNDCLGCFADPSSDEVSDTPLDLPCWTVEQILSKNSGISRTDAEIASTNLMSYHTIQGELTEGQLDRWADVAYNVNNRRSVMFGNLIFVGKTSRYQTGSALDPFLSARSGINFALTEGSRPDIWRNVYFKPGIYSVTNNRSTPLRIAPTNGKILTIRATKAGAVILN
jgi:hypothetical protein